jgi:hypothetical protein
MENLSGPARTAAGVIALIAWTGMVVQFDASRELTGSTGAALSAMLRFFTIVSNLFVATIFTGIALGIRRAAAPWLLAGTALLIGLAGIVYMALLNGLLELSGGAAVADVILHKVTPVLVPLYWLVFAPKGRLAPRDPWLWALVPLVYFLYAIARGAIDGRYPYPFMDVSQIGWLHTGLNALLIAAGFLVAGFALVGFDRRLARR